MTMNSRIALKAYLYLMVLTLASALLGVIDINLTSSIMLGGILMLSTLKGILIVDIFMELKHAPKFWRKLFLSYVLLVPSIIFFIYLLL